MKPDFVRHSKSRGYTHSHVIGYEAEIEASRGIGKIKHQIKPDMDADF